MQYDVLMTAKQLPTLGDQVRSARKAAGLSQQRLADRVNEVGGHKFTQNTVTRIEHDQRTVGVHEYWDLEEVLGQTLTAWEPGSAAEELQNLLPRMAEQFDNLQSSMGRLEQLVHQVLREGADRG